MKSPAPPLVPALAGPTGCGKTQLALELAERLNGEIISVDSGAVYRDMDVGTATPTAEMRARVRHHLVSIVAPNESYHVGRFVADAQAAVADILSRQKTPLFVGGTMMYFHTLRNGLSPIPPVPAAVSAAVTTELQDMPAAAAHAMLAAVDAETAAKVAAADSQRLHRALSVYRATGKPLSAWLKEPPQPVMALRLVRLLPADREELRRRIAARLQQMWADGLEEETRRLLTHWQLPPTAPPLRLIGYRQAAARCRNLMSDEQMRRDAVVATCQLVKRQTTWLRRWTDAQAIDPAARDADKAVQKALTADGAAD